MTAQPLGQDVSISMEPSLSYVVLRRCQACHAAHPLARRPVPADIEHCPDCGSVVPSAGAEVVARARLAGFHPATIAARFCFWVARQLEKLARRI